MNAFSRLPNSYNEKTWFRGRLKSSSVRLTNIENDIFQADSSPDLLSACTSFLHLRLEEKLGNAQITQSNASPQLTHELPNNLDQKLSYSFWERSSTVLNFSSSCINLQNVDEYSKQFQNEILNNVDSLHIDQILPLPGKKEKRKPMFKYIKKKSESKFNKLKKIISSIFIAKKVPSVVVDAVDDSIKSTKSILVSTATQTDICYRKKKHKSRWTSSMIRERSSKMSIPEEVKEYQNWKEKYNNEMKRKRHLYYKFPYKCPMEESNSCMEVVETKVKTKKVRTINNLKRQSSKLSVCNEEYESDEFEGFWSNAQNKNTACQSLIPSISHGRLEKATAGADFDVMERHHLEIDEFTDSEDDETETDYVSFVSYYSDAEDLQNENTLASL